MFNRFRLLENETMEIFSNGERNKSKHKFAGMKVCGADEVQKHFINPKTKNEVFGSCVN